MGNTVTKEVRPRSNTYSSTTSNGYSYERSRRNTIFGNTNDYKKAKKQEEKDKLREEHFMKLIIKYDENVDGGYLAPHGIYKSNLDFNIDIVRDLIINRKLAPFYTPLQDYSESWEDEELLILLKQLPLHSIEIAYEEEDEEDDVDNHKIHKSTNFYKRQEQKLKLKSLITKVKELQKNEDNKVLELKMNNVNDVNLPSDDLLLTLYKGAIECPICFLYFPNNLNLSRCCLQPICTECFVQIKRLEPHPPHDLPSSSTTASAAANTEELPHTLISEPANCPYCAMTDFGVTFEKNLDINTGINGIKPKDFSVNSQEKQLGDIQKSMKAIINEQIDESAISSSSSPSNEPEIMNSFKENRRRRSSIPANSPKVITIDQIRTDWETKLSSAKNKLARKAAAASAIHASNLIINPQTDLGEYDTRRRSNSRFQSIEDRMIEEALRLSILDEQDRVRKQGTPQSESSNS